MNELNPILRLLILIQLFCLLGLLVMPLLIRTLQEPIGKLAYGLLTIFCIFQALMLRRAFNKLQ